MMVQVIGFLTALALVVLLVSREVQRVAASNVTRARRPSLAGWAVPLRVELALWAVAAVILIPRVAGLLA